MSKIITENLNSEFNKIKSEFNSNKRYANYGGNMSSGLTKTSIIEKNSLPKNVTKKMVRAANANITMGSPSFYHPLFQTTNMYLPRDRRERNEWCRHFYRTEPIVATALDMHTEFPISDFSNSCYDPSIKKFFDYMAFDKLNIIELLLSIGLEYWKIGDVFPFGQLNESEGMWETFIPLNPDFINIKTSIFAGEPIIELIPDENIVNIVKNGPVGEYADIYNQLPDEIIRQIKLNNNIRLDNRLVSHIAYKASSYETWGTPIMMRCFKTLIYKDKLRQAQDAVANRHITPLRVAKVGTPGEPMPSQEDIDDLRDILEQADMDPNFFLVYHYGLQFDYVGSSGKILPLNQEFDFIQKELMNGLGINQAMLNGEGPTYANAQVGMDTLAKRYMTYRLKLESWIKYKVYKPIAEIQGFYKANNGEIHSKYMSPKQKKISAARKDMQLVIPDIIWQQQDLSSNQTIMNFIQQLLQKGLISMSTVLPMLNIDPEIEKSNLEKERGTVFDPNAPATGPLPTQGGPLGTTPNSSPSKKQDEKEDAEDKTEKESPKPEKPKAPPGGKANPEDFGFPAKETSLDIENFFVKQGEETASFLPLMKIKRRHQ